MKKKNKSVRSSKNNKNPKFLSGALIGAVLGAAVEIFATSKTGKKVSKEIKNKSVEFYKFMAPQLKRVAKEMGEEEYKTLVNKSISHFGKKKKLTPKEKRELAKEALASWKHLKKHL